MSKVYFKPIDSYSKTEEINAVAAGKTVFRRGRHTLEYAENIGLGSRKYTLIEI